MIPGLPKSSLRDQSVEFETTEDLQRLLDRFEGLSAKDERRAAVLFYSGLALLIVGLSWVHAGLGLAVGGSFVMVVSWIFGRDVVRGKSLLEIIRHVVDHNQQVDEQMKSAVQEALRDAHRQN